MQVAGVAHPRGASPISMSFFFNVFCGFSSLDCPARGQPGFDPWRKVRPVLDAMNFTFKKYFVPRKYLSIDESMIGMKNRIAYLQYMPNKRHSRFGIKKFELCDPLSGYVIHV